MSDYERAKRRHGWSEDITLANIYEYGFEDGHAFALHKQRSSGAMKGIPVDYEADSKHWREEYDLLMKRQHDLREKLRIAEQKLHKIGQMIPPLGGVWGPNDNDNIRCVLRGDLDQAAEKTDGTEWYLMRIRGLDSEIRTWQQLHENDEACINQQLDRIKKLTLALERIAEGPTLGLSGGFELREIARKTLKALEVKP